MPGKFWPRLIFLILLQPNILKAAELIGPEVGVLPFAMGRAYSAVADDWHALHYNPAGLALYEGVDLQIANVGFGINRNIIDKLTEVKDFASAGDTAGRLQNLSGEYYYGKFFNVTQLTIPHFALGMVYDRTVSFENLNGAFPQTILRDEQNFGVMAGFGIGIGGGRQVKPLRLGATLKYLKRTGGTEKISVAELTTASTTILDRFSVSGKGLGVTLGMQYRLPFGGRSEYTLSFVYHDIGKTSFGADYALERPSRIDENMVAGFAARFPIGGRANRRYARRYGHPRSSSSLTFTMEYSHANISVDEEHLPKHLHFGMNLDLPLLALQCGFNQTSFTYGGNIDLGFFRIEAASYAEEVGSYGGQRPDRRYLLSISGGLGFDKL